MKKVLPILLVAVIAMMATSCLTLLAAALATEEEDGVLVFVDSGRHSIDVKVDGRHYGRTIFNESVRVRSDETKIIYL